MRVDASLPVPPPTPTGPASPAGQDFERLLAPSGLASADPSLAPAAPAPAAATAPGTGALSEGPEIGASGGQAVRLRMAADERALRAFAFNALGLFPPGLAADDRPPAATDLLPGGRAAEAPPALAAMGRAPLGAEAGWASGLPVETAAVMITAEAGRGEGPSQSVASAERPAAAGARETPVIAVGAAGPHVADASDSPAEPAPRPSRPSPSRPAPPVRLVLLDAGGAVSIAAAAGLDPAEEAAARLRLAQAAEAAGVILADIHINGRESIAPARRRN